MLRRTRKHRKKLARLVLAALLSTGGVYGLMGPSAAEAAGSITVTGYADGAFISEPSGSMTVVPESGYYTAYPADGSVTVLNIAPGEDDPWNNATDNITVMGRYGTEASGYAASGSTVTMTGPKAKLYNLYGGYAGNDVTSGTAITASATAGENTVTVSGNAVVRSDVAGGWASAYAYSSSLNTATVTAGADNNTVTISGAAIVGDDVFGGYAEGDAEDARITGTVKATADGNTVTVSETAFVDESVYGGYAYGYIYAYAYDSDATGTAGVSASENTVTISGAAQVGEYVAGGSVTAYGYAYGYDYVSDTAAVGVTANADANTVTISGSASVGDTVYGGTVGAYGYNYSYGITSNFGLTADANTVTIGDAVSVGGDVYGGYAYAYVEYGNEVVISGTAGDNTVTLSGTATVGDEVYGGSAYVTAYAYTYDATATVNATVSADNNTVTISEGVTVGDGVYGGFAEAYGYAYTSAYDTVTAEATASGTANSNIVTISGSASVGDTVYGGEAAAYGYAYAYAYAYETDTATATATAVATASADKNTVTISDGAAVESTVYGGYAVAYGYAYAYAAGGTVNTKSTAATAEATSNANEVTISGDAKVASTVYGGYAYGYAYEIEVAAAKGTAGENTVTISDNATVNGSVYGGIAYAYAYAYGSGGTLTAEATANADKNTVTISGDARVGDYVYGGYAGAYAYAYDTSGGTATIETTTTATAGENTVTISGNAVVGKDYATVYGGYASGGSADSNTVTIADNATVDGTYYTTVYGGYAYEGGAENNTVTISGDAAVGISEGSYYVQIIGGTSFGKDGASSNTVTISGGTVGSAANAESNTIYGGYSDVGTSGNKVVIEKDAKVYAGAVVGGYTYYAVAAVATGNSVTIDAEGAEVGLVYGGRTYKGDATENTVTISAGTVTGNMGESEYYGMAAVAGGYTLKEGDATANTVELNGVTVNALEDVVGIPMAVIGGYAGEGDATNNTVKLHDATITGGGVYGGVTESEDGDELTGNTLVISGSNTVDGEVAYFETIKLADTVEWNTEAPVLKAKLFDVNVDGTSGSLVEGTRGALDITDAESNLAAATSGQMTLLASDKENNFAAIALTYSGGSASLNEAKLSQVVKNEKIDDADKGVTVNGHKVHEVSLDAENSYKNVLFKVDKEITGISLDAMTWGTGRDLAEKYTFDDTVAIDATNLTFTDVTTALKTGDSMVLADNATGVTSANTVTNGTGKTVGIDYTDSGSGIKYAATASGDVSADTGLVKYTVDSVAADKIVLASREWGAAADEMPDTWKASASTQVDDTAFAYTGEATTALKAGDTAAILNASGLTTASPVTDGSAEGKTVAVNYTDAAGINFAATAKGHVAAAADVVNYVVDTVAVDSVNLAGWNGKDTSAVTEGWTGSGVAVATGSFAAPSDLAAGSGRDILTAADGFFTDDKITGANKYGNGDAFNESENGVDVAGHKVGGVKAEDSGAKLTYYAMKKSAETLTLGEITFADGGTARSFDNTYDLTGAAINADGLTFSNADAMESGQNMIIADASGALKNEAGDALAAFAAKEYKTDFDDAATENLQLKGSRTDTLEQDAAKSKLTYTVGDNVVSQAVMSGEMAWKDGATHYENTKYTFTADSSIDASGVKFTADEDPLNQSMTLISGKVDGTVTAGPEPIALTFDNTNTTLEAMASGTAAINSGDLVYTVDSVALHTVTVKSTGGTTDTVPDGWTLADGATVETDGMTVPTLDPGKSADIITAKTDGFFANATVNGENKYQATGFNEEDSGITFTGTQEKGVKAEGKSLVYVAAGKLVDTAVMSGEIAWKSGGTYYENTKYDFTADSEIDVSGVKFTADADPLNQSMTLIGNADGTVKDGTPEFTVKLSNTVLETTAAGEAAIAAGNLEYKVTSVTLNKVTVNGAGSDVVPEGWSANSEGVAVDTDSMTVPTDVGAGEEKAIISGAPANAFSDDSITGANAYAESDFTDASNPDDTSKGVSITGAQGKGVKASEDGTGLVYAVSKKEVSAVNAGATDWQPGATLLDGSSTDYDYSNITSIGTDGFAVTFDKPEEVAAGESMTLLKANETLADMAAQEKSNSYSFEPVSGVTVDAGITASLEVKDGIVTYTPSENKAGKLTFGDVLWNADAPMLTRPDNIIFAGADVDTSAINFTNVLYLDANQQMTLVSDFGDSVGTITGGKYMVGTAFIGEGEASLSGSDLIFTTTTEAGLSEQTHKTVMAMDAGLAMLLTGNEFMGKAMDGLADVKNRGKDGVSTFAAVGGGASRYDTGSHVNTHTWNAIVGVGKTTGTKKGTVEYGIFGEYGKGSYTVHSNAGNGDGDAHYAGGGLLAKFTNKQNVYTEASVRAGRLSDSSSDIMQDSLGNKYGYNVHANYFGAHIGAGRVIDYKGGKSLDVYGKFFYLKRDGVEYDAVQHYSLDSVSSSILRLGARYGTKDRKWNWYGGLAYEYEFDGESTGTVKGKAIRAASIQGSSVRGEFGMRMDATKTNPWSTDISLYGYAGKHRGFGGNVSVTYTF